MDSPEEVYEQGDETEGEDEGTEIAQEQGA